MAQQEQRKSSSSSSRSCRQMLFFEDFRRHVRQFFGVVLELARPSEAWGFPPGGELAFQRFEWYPYTNTNTNNNTFRGRVFSAREEVIFSKLFYCRTRRQQKLSKNVVFLEFQMIR